MTENKKLQELLARLKKLNLEYEIISHLPITTIEECYAELGIEPIDGISTLIMQADGDYIAVIRRDDQKLDFRKIKAYVDCDDLSFVDKQTAQEITGCDLATVSVLNGGIRIIMDQTILEREYVYGGTGSAEHDLKIKPQDLVTLTGAQVADIVED